MNAFKMQVLQFLNNLKISLPTIFVSALTLLLLSYVGFWESNKQSKQFQASKLSTQGEVIKNSVESFLNAGQPLTQYSAFKQLSATLLDSDPSIEHIVIRNTVQKVIFSTLNDDQIISNEQYPLSDLTLNNSSYTVYENDQTIKLTTPLESSFESAGVLEIAADKSKLLGPSNKLYDKVFNLFLMTIIVFSFFVILLETLNLNNKARILKFGYAICFIFISTVIVTTVLKIYEDGAQAKAQALTDSMVARLNSVLALDINIDDISGIEQTFIAYKNNNPDIREIALIQNGVWKYHTDIAKIGETNYLDNDVFEYSIQLNGTEKPVHDELYISVSIPVDVVNQAILTSVNEFITLIVACGLISFIFINASTSISSLLKPSQTDPHSKLFDNLQIIKSAYFLIVFVHALSVSFLPHLVKELASVEASLFASSSLPFTAYYAMFALVLIPAGQYAEKGSLKMLMLIGALLELIGLIFIIFLDSYWAIVIARAISGAGQGFFLIGLQSYLLVVTPKDKRTQGSAVKVIGRNTGLISGTAIGALIFSFTDFETVFVIGSSISLFAMLYMWFLIIDVKETYDENTKKITFSRMFHNVLNSLKDSEFVKSLCLIAIPGKMAITGVIMFATPLMLINNQFTPGEIGQALMLYYIASIIATHYASKWVDKKDISYAIIFSSAIIGGLSIILLGLLGTESLKAVDVSNHFDLYLIAHYLQSFISMTDIPWLLDGLIILSITVAGISNGFLTSPVITYINKTPIAHKNGIKSTTATYTFLERGGHTIGPLVIGSLLAMTNQNQIAIAYFGIIMAVCGLLFFFLPSKLAK